MLIYRIILTLLLPFVLARAVWRGERARDLAERLGRGAAPADLWLHGASLGEIASARWVIEGLRAARPGLRVLVTSNTVTARAMVRGWGLPGVQAALAPVDLGFATRALLAAVRPRALISLEAELWPTRFGLCAARGLAVVLIGARMSARSYRRWRRMPALPRAALRHVGFAAAQDAVSRGHLQALGLALAATGPDLDLKAQAVALQAPTVWAPRADRAAWLLAASTHDGEEAMLLQAFAEQRRFAHLILAPRHPARAAAIAALLQARGIGFGQRTRGQEPGVQPVYLADSLGEMDRWYALCGACVIGGTFADKGGHTPWEPARHGTAIVHGPSLWNFAAPFATLDAAGGALPVTPTDIARGLDRLDDAAQDRLASTAQRVLQATGAPDAFLLRILAVTRL